MMVHVVKETDAGIVIRGAKYETAAAYANQAFLKPTIANWGDEQFPNMRWLHRQDGCAGREAHLPLRLCRPRQRADYPLANRFDEVDTLVILDNVLIPWEDVFFYHHTRAAASSARPCTAIRRFPTFSACSLSPI